MDRTEGYLLFQNALVFHTTNYISFQKFLNKMIDGFMLIHKILNLSYVEQIGLRYLNAIYPKNEASLDAYLNPSLLGLSSTLTGKLAHTFTETVFEIQGGKLISKTWIAEDKLIWPPDLQPNQLSLKLDLAKGKTATLDIDYSILQRIPVNIAEIKKNLGVAHEMSEQIFQKSTSDYARAIWR